MLFDASLEIKAALSYARTFSLEKELYYIDSQMILLGLLDSFAFTDLIQDEDREKMITWLKMLDWQHGTVINTSVFITQEAERMMKNAAYYQKKLKDKHLLPEHIMLSLLSIENLCRHKLESLGIVFRTFVEQLAAVRDNQLHIPFRSPKIKPSRSFPHNPLVLWLYGEKQKNRMVKEHLAEARNFLQYNDRKRSRRFCRYILQIDPQHTDALWILGITWATDLQFEKAIPYYDKVLQQHPEHTGVLSQLGYCYSQSGNKIRAVELYLRALAISPGSAELLNALGFVLADLQQYDKAITLFDQAIAIDAECAYAYNNKGYVLMRLGYLSQARELITQSLQYNKGNAYAYRNLALLYLQERNFHAAQQMLLSAQKYDFKGKYGSEVDDLLRSIKYK
ncbi:Clp amino terminal domain-containing protein, pathogenicity island component [Chitinophaga sp. CF118]|uniref:tetratricopeptide repeat protein n=1 Tax=Chitinophaga sp. CF118 TaxID=1884367 RepID=UPI0008E23FA0|nr:tetratricopeptide repeat protein [Chitinophaga sp. CF118]SFE01673.1 Clp amino terminal domain-containing protein, pathogenicity island component [Chitinophaga sp. CF118]